MTEKESFKMPTHYEEYEEKLDFVSSCIRLFILLPIFIGLFFLSDFLMINGKETLCLFLVVLPICCFMPYIFFKKEVARFLAELTIRKLHL